MAKNFSWEHFSIGFLKNVLYASQTPQKYRPKFTVDSKDALLPYMNYLCDFPNDQFVRKYRREIESCFADDGNHLLNIAKRLSAVNYGGLSTDDPDELISQLCAKRMTESLCQAYLRELRLAGKHIEAEVESFFSVPRTIDLAASQYDDVSLFPYQKKAVEALKAYFVDNNQNAGILSLPTGGGKTRTSVIFLLKEMLSHGYQVVWLAHRAMLLDQAAEQFYRFAPIIKAVNPEMNELNMICISGSHSTIHSLITPATNYR